MTATLSRQAQRELLAAFRWIAADSPIAARGLVAAVDRAAQRIGEHPEIDPLRPNLTRRPLRFLTLPGYPYILAYRHEGEMPRIVRVLHTARDLPAALKER